MQLDSLKESVVRKVFNKIISCNRANFSKESSQIIFIKMRAFDFNAKHEITQNLRDRKK